MNKIASRAILFAVTTLTAAGPLMALPERYSVTKIDVPGNVMFARALNDNGQVAGGTWTGQGFLWSNGVSQVFDNRSDAYGLNELGHVSGELGGRPVVWKDGGAVDLSGSCPDSYERIAIDVNDRGQVLLRLGLHPYLLSDGVLTDLDPNHLLSEYYGEYINNKGEAAMYGYTAGRAHAVVWKNGIRTDLYSLGCQTVFGINDAGQVIGDSSYGGAYLWQNGNVRRLGYGTRAYGINESGTIVGRWDSRAIIWEGDAVADLNMLISPSLGITLSEALEVNSHGQVLAQAGFGNYYLLTPVPEPSGILALLSGIVGLAAFKFRVRRH